MQAVQWGTHNYVDLSDLNARWDQDFPGGYNPVYASPVHGLGTSNGALSGNSLGIVSRGVGQDPHYPWREYSADTKALQVDTNRALEKEGFMRIDEDGVLGADTCGAAREVLGDAPGTCQSFNEPREALKSSRAGMGVGGGNWLIWGGAAGAVAIGLALIFKAAKK